MNKKKKIVNKKHRKTKNRLKALKVASLAKIKKKPILKPVKDKVEDSAAVKKIDNKKTTTKKTAKKKTTTKKTAKKKTTKKD